MTSTNRSAFNPSADCDQNSGMMNGHSLLTTPISELQKMKKETLINLISDFRAHHDDQTLLKSIDNDNASPLVTKLTDALQPMIKDPISALSSQFDSLQQQVTELSAKFTPSGCSSSDDSNDGWRTVTYSQRKSFSDALRNSVKSVFQEERCKSDVVIAKVDEGGDDNAFLKELCQKMDFAVKPTEPQRLGKRGERPRLLKVTFPTAFDARSFMARYEERRRERSDDFPVLRLRSGKTKEELAAFSRSSKEAFKLNEEAKTAGKNESYSLRDDASIWKFIKQENGSWKRDKDWRPVAADATPSQSEDSGN